MIRLLAWSVKKMLPAASAVGPSLNAIVVATCTSWPMTQVNENNNNTLNAIDVRTRFSLTAIHNAVQFIRTGHCLYQSPGNGKCGKANCQFASVWCHST